MISEREWMFRVEMELSVKERLVHSIPQCAFRIPPWKGRHGTRAGEPWAGLDGLAGNCEMSNCSELAIGMPHPAGRGSEPGELGRVLLKKPSRKRRRLCWEARHPGLQNVVVALGDRRSLGLDG